MDCPGRLGWGPSCTFTKSEVSSLEEPAMLGFLTRRKRDKKAKLDASVSFTKVPAAGSADSSAPQEESATRIQAIYRGKASRKANKKRKRISLGAPFDMAMKGVGELSDSVGKAAKAAATATAGAVGGAAAATAKGLESMSAAVTLSTPAVVVSDADVLAPTPVSRWWTPRDRWSRASAQVADFMADATDGQTPRELMPEAAALLPDAHAAIGELELEILEAEKLPNKDLTSSTDTCTHAAADPRPKRSRTRAPAFPMSACPSLLTIGARSAHDLLTRLSRG